MKAMLRVLILATVLAPAMSFADDLNAYQCAKLGADYELHVVMMDINSDSKFNSGDATEDAKNYQSFLNSVADFHSITLSTYFNLTPDDIAKLRMIKKFPDPRVNKLLKQVEVWKNAIDALKLEENCTQKIADQDKLEVDELGKVLIEKANEISKK